MVVGRIRHTDENFAFAYNPEWLAYKANFPISLSMKLRLEPYPHQVIMPWLMNLLPEGDPLAAASRALGIASDDVMGLLERIGQETAGALSVMSLPREPEGPSNGQPDYRKVDPGEELEQIINDLPRKPFLAGEDGVSMSLAAPRRSSRSWFGTRNSSSRSTAPPLRTF